MMMFLNIVYLILLYILVKLKILPNKSWVWLSIIPYHIILWIVLFIPMQWGSPSGKLLLMKHSVAITPNVAGVVTAVPVKPNIELKKGDVLFRIDPTLYKAAYDRTKANLVLAELRLKQAKKLLEKHAGSLYKVQAREAEVKHLKAQLKSNKWDLDKTVVRAPSKGYVTYVGLCPGQRVGTSPANKSMAFIDTSETILGAQVPQNFTRYIEHGEDAELTFSARPGKIYPAKVMYMLPITAQGQFMFSGNAATAQSSVAGPFFVRLKMDDPKILDDLVVGSVGIVAIYTPHEKVTHIIRKVILRLRAIMNYISIDA